MTPSELQKQTGDGWGLQAETKGPRIDKVRRVFAQAKTRLRILDVGCADGVIMKPLVQQHEIHGVDISVNLCKMANESGIKAVRHDLEGGPLPYADKFFDAVFCGETIEHHVDTDWLISEINRVLKTGGLLVLTFPNVRTLLSVGMMMFFDLPPMYAARYRSVHYRDFTLRTIKMVLKNHHFRFDRAIGSSFYLPKIEEYWSWIATFFPSWTSTSIVLATKLADSKYSSEDAIALRIY